MHDMTKHAYKEPCIFSSVKAGIIAARTNAVIIGARTIDFDNPNNKNDLSEI
jgi:hypothetical protein